MDNPIFPRDRAPSVTSEYGAPLIPRAAASVERPLLSSSRGRTTEHINVVPPFRNSPVKPSSSEDNCDESETAKIITRKPANAIPRGESKTDAASLLNLSTYGDEEPTHQSFEAPDHEAIENLRVPTQPAFQYKQIDMHGEETAHEASIIPDETTVSQSTEEVTVPLPAWLQDQINRQETYVEDDLEAAPPLPIRHNITVPTAEDSADDVTIVDETKQERNHSAFTRSMRKVRSNGSSNILTVEEFDEKTSSSDIYPVSRSRSASIGSNILHANDYLPAIEMVQKANEVVQSETTSSSLKSDKSENVTDNSQSVILPDQLIVTDVRPTVRRTEGRPPLVPSFPRFDRTETRPREPKLTTKSVDFRSLTLTQRTTTMTFGRSSTSRASGTSKSRSPEDVQRANRLKRLKKFKAIKDAHKKKRP